MPVRLRAPGCRINMGHERRCDELRTTRARAFIVCISEAYRLLPLSPSPVVGELRGVGWGEVGYSVTTLGESFRPKWTINVAFWSKANQVLNHSWLVPSESSPADDIITKLMKPKNLVGIDWYNGNVLKLNLIFDPFFLWSYTRSFHNIFWASMIVPPVHPPLIDKRPAL